jgi:hypothetical protein
MWHKYIFFSFFDAAADELPASQEIEPIKNSQLYEEIARALSAAAAAAAAGTRSLSSA